MRLFPTAPTASRTCLPGRALLVILLLGTASAGPDAFAQGASGGETLAPSSSKVQALTRLSAILGSLSHLDAICHGRDGTIWRTKMTNLLAVEAPEDKTRKAYVAAYNTANLEAALIFRSCTPNAEALVNDYLAEGSSIAQGLGENH
ncbi:hypothetical protein HDIA_1188 [Hartmannibacter diazotrophicus]|uniref:TIGR02301 family protein n=1 Tax=Hartmannibacter diazotrophicus TaxID=1482074 RepID=A0A2C9D3G7_9HYPH|nr:hypothetical protein HDIA_1188 [Hartmannibacter diazotrophicus]